MPDGLTQEMLDILIDSARLAEKNVQVCRALKDDTLFFDALDNLADHKMKLQELRKQHPNLNFKEYNG